MQAIAAQSCPCAKLEKERLVVEQISQRVARVRLFKAGSADLSDGEYRYNHPYELVPAALADGAEAHQSTGCTQA